VRGPSADEGPAAALQDQNVNKPAKRSPLRVVIVGGGVAALEAMLALRRLAEERVSIELIAREPQFWYRPLAVAEPFGLGDVHGLDLSTIADEFGAGVTLGSLESVDTAQRLARTSAGAEIEYDALLIAAGARPVAAVPGAFTFRGLADTDGIRQLLAELESGEIERIAFALPGGVAWPLPLYELALQTAAHPTRPESSQLWIVTHEAQPLELFGPAASQAIAELLEQRGVRVRTAVHPVKYEDGLLTVAPAGSVPVDRVVALPRLQGPAIAGLPSDHGGFIPTTPYGQVRGLDDVFAAGDATSFPVKQGGLAAQQADAAAESIAALSGAPISPAPFRPGLRGLILTGAAPVFARAELTRAGDGFESGIEPLWWPPGKIVGRHLAPFLAERSGEVLTPPACEGVTVDVPLSSLLS
jgi:sulfide:quinone oxidoreductase